MAGISAPSVKPHSLHSLAEALVVHRPGLEPNGCVRIGICSTICVCSTWDLASIILVNRSLLCWPFGQYYFVPLTTSSVKFVQLTLFKEPLLQPFWGGTFNVNVSVEQSVWLQWSLNWYTRYDPIWTAESKFWWKQWDTRYKFSKTWAVLNIMIFSDSDELRLGWYQNYFTCNGGNKLLCNIKGTMAYWYQFQWTLI